MGPPAIVTTTVDGEIVGQEECQPDSYVLVTGPATEVYTQVFSHSGTHVITVKKRTPPQEED